MVAAMVLGGLRRCEVIGLRLGDLQVAQRRVFISEGKGGHQRLVPISRKFFDHVCAYLDSERPADAGTDHVFLVLKRPRRGQPLTAHGLDEILDGARARADLVHATCHELRHTCLTQLREAGMALEAVQAQAGHASIESTRLRQYTWPTTGSPPNTARPPKSWTPKSLPPTPRGVSGEWAAVAAHLGTAPHHPPGNGGHDASLPAAGRLRRHVVDQCPERVAQAQLSALTQVLHVDRSGPVDHAELARAVGHLG